MSVDATNTEVEVEFHDKDKLSWSSIIGYRLAPMWSSMHYCDMITVCLTRGFTQHGFLKAVQFTPHDDYLQMIQSHNHPLLKLDLPLRINKSVIYVGEKSFVVGATTYDKNSGRSLFTHNSLHIGVDMKTRKSAKLDSMWRAKTLKHIQDRGLPNEPIHLPQCEEDAQCVLASYKMIINDMHIDHNMHANYRVYAFGFIISIREAITSGKLPRYHGISCDDVIPRDSVVVFEQECNAGDEIHFKVYADDTHDDVITVVCYCGDRRLAYGRHQLVLVGNSNQSKL